MNYCLVYDSVEKCQYEQGRMLPILVLKLEASNKIIIEYEGNVSYIYIVL